MAAVVYGWNPFQDRVANRVSNEVIKTSSVNNRKEFVPRYAPFYSRNFQLFKQGDPDPLKPGVDYVFAHSFDRFALAYNRNVFGSVVMIGDYTDDVLIASYDTIGGPFVLNDAAFIELVANIVNAPRQADWADLDETTIPVEFPPDPHPHPAAQVYDYGEMMVQLKHLIIAITQAQQDVNLQTLFEEHINKPLAEAHFAEKSDFGLDLTPNMAAATAADLAGNSDNKLVTINVMKEAFRLLAKGELNIN